MPAATEAEGVTVGDPIDAINDANRKAEDQLSKQMSGLMGGMKIPGLG